VTPATATPVTAGSRAVVVDVVRRRLRLGPDELDPDRPLVLYGLDSLLVAELSADLELALGQAVPDWMLFEHPTVNGLVAALGGADGDRMMASELALMAQDSILPPEVGPAWLPGTGTLVDPPRRVLLTGATGFLGAYILRALLDRDLHVSCLVRGRGDHAARVRENLERYGLWRGEDRRQLTIVAGDLREPGLGASAREYDALADGVDAIYHAAADVNWALPYSALRDANVAATRELLRLAFRGRRKAFCFVSSLSVGYAVLRQGGTSRSRAAGTRGARFTECTDPTAWLERLPLGYAQSKAVAEALVMQAAARGLRASIIRPPLITGDATTGASNTDDFIARLVKGCILMGAAPDLDWTVDAMPVDHVARAVLTLPGPRARTTFNLTNRQPRHWRECVLWMNLFGYRCALVPYPEWRDRLDRDSRASDHPLHALRGFFLRERLDGATAPELYQDGRRVPVGAARTHAAEAAAGLQCPKLTADLLDRYFEDYLRSGFLPEPCDSPVRRRRRQAAGEPGHDRTHDAARFTALLRAHFDDRSIDVSRATVLGTGSEHSILGELTAWRHGRRVGLSTQRLDVSQQGAAWSLDVVLKAKPHDDEVLDVGQTVADLCSRTLGGAYRAHRETVGLRHGHRREPALYDIAGRHDALARHLPICFGTWADAERREWGLLLERLDRMALIDATDSADWTARHREAAVDGLSALHAGWAPLVPDLARADWIGHVPDTASSVAMSPLWHALAEHAAPFVAEWAGRDLVARHRRLVETIGRWWPALERAPQTLIHGDCNPRNLALRHDAGGYRLCAYDWELATIGAPQRDLAELLCFVLSPDAAAGDVWALVDRHRTGFGAATARRVDPRAWRDGLEAALADVLTKRLAFYVMIHRVRPQPFLPRVFRAWRRIFDVVRSGAEAHT
jgi:thioester reductase-like protein